MPNINRSGVRLLPVLAFAFDRNLETIRARLDKTLPSQNLRHQKSLSVNSWQPPPTKAIYRSQLE